MECKEWIRGRGELFEHSEQAHVMRSKIAEIQADKKNIYRQVGETLCRVWREVEEGTLSKSRRALFGEDFHEVYELLQNRFLFVDGGNDDHLFLEHYVLLGNFVNDPDRFEIFDGLLLDFVRDLILTGDSSEDFNKARKTHERLAGTGAFVALGDGHVGGRAGRSRSRSGDSGEGFPWLFKRKADLQNRPKKSRKLTREVLIARIKAGGARFAD